jgi:hypothetical protein
MTIEDQVTQGYQLAENRSCEATLDQFGLSLKFHLTGLLPRRDCEVARGPDEFVGRPWGSLDFQSSQVGDERMCLYAEEA